LYAISPSPIPGFAILASAVYTRIGKTLSYDIKNERDVLGRSHVLSRSGEASGTAHPEIKSVAPAQRGGSFACAVERRERSIYFAALLNGDRENFFGSVIASQPGDAAIRAKATTMDADVRRAWILFGDPTMRITR